LEFSHWFDDCQTAIQVAQEESIHSGIVLVGSSMGAWISLKMVQDNQDLIKGLILVAPAINFMWSFYLVTFDL
jgi:alpha-beta hydrolase superfamily lysophospholipase